jgi:SAM-dependent methyltransferase
MVSLGHWNAWRSQVLDHVAPGSRVLEVGFGTGALLVRATARGCDVWGADPSAAMQRIAGRRMRGRGLTRRRVRASAQALPFADHAFDAILATFPTQYIVDPATLGEFARLLAKPEGDGRGGRVVITGIGFRTGGANSTGPQSPAQQGGGVDHVCAWRGRVLGLVFGGGLEDMVALYAGFAERFGFEVTVDDDGAGAVRVPVLILEKPMPEVARASLTMGAVG